MKFLIVDDSKISRKKISSYINDLKYEIVGEAVDGLEAVEKFKELSPTYITMDLEMPNMKGTEAAKEMLKLNKDINIILITSIIDKKELVNALKTGVRKILQKPINKDKFSQAIDELKARGN